MTLVGSDGVAYPFLGKPHDDLRKDNRMMEVVGVLNRIFLGDAAARRRNLYLRRCASLRAQRCPSCCSPCASVHPGLPAGVR